MDIDGSILRAFRRAARINTTQMAGLTGYSQGYISKCETGKSQCTPAFVEAYLRVLGDNVNRRAVLNLAVAAAATGLTVGLPELGDLIRRGFEEHRDDADWARVAATFEAEFAHLPPGLGGAVFANLSILQRTIIERGGTPDRLRAAASLARLWGLWLGNEGRLPQAKGWYDTAADLADRSGDQQLHAYILATVANRGPYERFTIRDTLNRASQALALHPGPSLSTVEAQGAIVHVSALTGHLDGGRAAAEAMLRAAEGVEGDAGTRAVTRALLFDTFLMSRIGPRKLAERAYAAAEPHLRTVETWHREARVYFERSAVVHGDPGGVARALSIVEGYRTGSEDVKVRVLGIAVRDLVDAVPPAYRRTPEFAELGRYADPGRGPWDTIR